jgi:hypothetical protein
VSRIIVAEAQAWAEGTKLTIPALDGNLLDHIEAEVLGRLSTLDSTTWIDSTTTPKIIRTIISKLYVAWVYDRAYSEDVEQGSNYADRLRLNAETLIQGIIDGTIVIPGIPDNAGTPVFYPTDASSSQLPTVDDPSLGPAAFSMGMRF